MNKTNIEEFIKNKIKFIIKHLDECKKNECHTCSRFYIKLDVYEELIYEITKKTSRHKLENG